MTINTKSSSDCIQHIDLARNITNFSELPDKTDGSLRVISYNITADFFDSKDSTEEKIHSWSVRSFFCKELILKVNPDIMCLQELSPDQAYELGEYFNQYGYQSRFLSQTPSDIKAGDIVDSSGVKDWIGKFVGTPLVGVFFSDKWILSATNCFWLNENPDEIPTIQDRGETDKGFGNMNTYRAVFYTKLEMKNQDKSLYIFNSHYPLSGNNETRLKCAELEMQKIQDITNGANWISTGDRNLIPDGIEGSQNQAYQALRQGAYDIRDCNNHFGISTTWLGFIYDKFRNILKTENDSTDFKDKSVLDIMVSNIKPEISFHLHGAFVEDALLPLTGQMSLEHNDNPAYTSDHALIGADFEMNLL